MNRKKKRAPPANAEIFREQIQLLQTEKELKKSLEKVKDHINRLLVEELELKSILSRTKKSSTQTATPKPEPLNVSYQFDSVNEINEQKLNLFTQKSSQSMEECDEE